MTEYITVYFMGNDAELQYSVIRLKPYISSTAFEQNSSHILLSLNKGFCQFCRNLGGPQYHDCQAACYYLA